MIVKVCGMREPENLIRLLELPLDWIGLIFYPRSKRSVLKTDLAKWLSHNRQLFEQKEKVGVFVNNQVDDILKKVHEYELDILQLHGEEQPAYVEELARFRDLGSLRQVKLIKAFRVGEEFDFSMTADFVSLCDYFLFDTMGEERGGTGQSFDWELLSDYAFDTPFLLSGGIGPASIPALNHFSHPRWIGVDLNSKFEEKPGEKDIAALRDFLQAFKTNTVQ